MAEKNNDKEIMTLRNQLRLSELRFEAILRINRMQNATTNELLNFTLETGLALTGSEIGYIYFYSEDTRQFTLYARSASVMADCTVARPETIYNLDDTGLWGEAVRQRQPILANDYKAPHPLKKGTPPGHIVLKRFLGVPIFYDDQVVATIGVGNKPDDYNEADIQHLTLLMDEVWKILMKRDIDRKLTESEERFRSTFEQAAVGLCHMAPGGRFLKVNSKICDIFGYSPEEMLNLSIRDVTHPEDLDTDAEKVRKALRGKEGKYSVQKRYIRKNGSIIWANLTISPVRDTDEDKTYFLGVVEDITQRKLAEMELMVYRGDLERLVEEKTALLQESEAKHRMLYKAMPIPISTWEKTAEGFILVDYNDALYKMTQGKVAGQIGTTAEDMFSEVPETVEHMNECFETKTTIEKEMTSKVGSARELRNFIVKYSYFPPSFVIVHSIDVTEPRQREEEIRLFFDTALDMMCITGFDGYFRKISPTWSRTLGWTDDELYAKTLISFVHPDDKEATLKVAALLGQGKEVYGFENRLICKDGTYRWIAWNSYGLKERNLIIAAARDISERKVTEQKLETMMRQLEVASRTDPLTKLYNRRYMMEKISQESARFKRYGQPFCLAITDIDLFKDFNDQYGHDCGDFILKSVSRTIRNTIREQDFLARWGGEEFLILLPETTIEGAAALLERLREIIEKKVFIYNGTPLSVTLTFGAAVFQKGSAVDDCLKQADKALYEGKRAGRNRVVLYSENADKSE